MKQHLTELSNEDILSSLKTLLADGRRILAQLISYLAEVESRRIHLELACSSMFEFCTKRLGLSEGEAFRRLTAARLVRRFPTILDALEAGRVHLSNVVLLRDLFTEANVGELLSAAAGKTKREVLELVVRFRPKPDVASSIRKAPERSGPTSSPVFTSTPPEPVGGRLPQNEPLSEGRYKVAFTATATLRDKLEQAKAMMRHRNPSGDLAVIVEQAVNLLLTKLEKERFGTTSQPRKAKPSTDVAYVSQAVRREVAQRDGSRCSFVSADGVRCESRAFLEFDHLQPRALGGLGDEPNMRLLCRAHNRHAAEKIFGREHVLRRIRSSQRRCRQPVNPDTPLGDHEPAENPCNHETKERVYSALRKMGFRSAEATRALTILDHRGWKSPVEALVCEALAVLTPDARRQRAAAVSLETG